MTLAEFVLARYDEAAGWAQEAIDLSHDLGVTREWRWVRFYGHADHPKTPSSSSFYKGPPTPEMVLADIESKRELVVGWSAFLDGAPDWAGVEVPSMLAMARRSLALLAQPFVDHPDFQPEWRRLP